MSQNAARDPIAQPNTLRKVIAASMIGTTIEWYDFFLYGAAAAVVFNVLFFPANDPLVGTMLAFATYALGFVARPLGGFVFGHFGDRIGRKKLLMISLIMMGGATMAIGFLPTYGQLEGVSPGLGVVAPLLLVVLRLLQGFAVGGEWGGAILIVAEHGDAKRRGFWTSFPQAGVPAGNLLAAGLLAVMAAVQPEETFLAWGWRVPFLLSAVLIFIGWWVRSSIAESPAFQEAQAEQQLHKAPLVEVARKYPRKLLIGMGLRFSENLSYYIITAFSITYLVEVQQVSRAIALNAVMIGAGIQLFAIPMFGWLSDKIGRKPVYIVGCGGMLIWMFAFMAMLTTGLSALVTLGIVVGLILHGAMYAPMAAFLAEMFPTKVRYSGVSISYQLTSIFAGSISPIIAIALLRQTGSVVPVAIYVAIGSLISLIAAFIATETKGIELDELDEEAAPTPPG